MKSRLAKASERIRKSIEELFADEKPAITTHRCAIYISHSAIQVIHLNKKPDSIEVLNAHLFEYDDIESIPLVLQGYAKKNNLDKIPTYWLLSPEDYQLLLIDSLPVPENEIRSALNWRLRSLLSYPITEAAIDYFLIPAKIASSERPLIATVTAKKTILTKALDILNKADLAVMVIDIPELALKNLTSLYETDEKCTGFIYFTTTKMILNISLAKTLYLTRTVNLHEHKGKDASSLYQNISLEIMRYFDYFQSQWRHPAPTRLFFASDQPNDEEIAKELSNHLLHEVNIFSLQPLIDDPELCNKLQKDFLLTFGSALREGYQHVPTRD